MELKDLQELDKKELDRIGTIAKKHASDEKIDINIFYKDYKLKGPHTNYYPHSIIDLKPYQLRPFFKNIIVDIKPFKTEHEFEKYYGMNVERMMDLKGNNLFKFRLTDNYSEYYDLDNDYLDSILYTEPPVSKVINNTYGLLINNNNTTSLNELIKFIENNEFNFGNLLNLDLGVKDPMVISAMDIYSGYGNNIIDADDKEYKSLLIKNMKKLWATENGEINNFLKILLNKYNGRLDWAFLYSTVYSNYLSNPILDSLNGTQMINSRLKYWAEDLSIQNLDKIFPNCKIPKPEVNINDTSILSSDFADSMNKTLRMNMILSDEDLDDYDFNGAINALASLELAIFNQRDEKIIDSEIELKNQLLVASDIAKDLQENKLNNLNIINQISLILGNVGTWVGLSEQPELNLISKISSIISTILSTVTSTSIYNRISNYLNKLNLDSHVCYIYDNFDKINLTHSNPKISKQETFIKFNDDLTKYYNYYEYLYSSIPSIKILIDTYVQKIISEGPHISSDNPQVEYEINEFIERISLFEKLKCLLQHRFLYGVGYFITEYDINNNIVDVNLINPHYVRTFVKNNTKYHKVIQNGEEIIYKDKISSFEGCPLIENSIPLFDLIYSDITKIEDRPLLHHDFINQIQTMPLENVDDINKSIKHAKKSIKVCKLLDDKFHEIYLSRYLGNYYFSIGENRLAMNYFNSALCLMTQCKSSEVLDLKSEIEKIYYMLKVSSINK